MVIDTTLFLPHLQSFNVQPKRIAKGTLLKRPRPGLRSLPLSKPILLHLMSLPLLKPPRPSLKALPHFKLPRPGLRSLPLLQLPLPDLLFKPPCSSLRPLPLPQLPRPGLGPLSLLTPLFPSRKSLPQSFRGSMLRSIRPAPLIFPNYPLAFSPISPPCFTPYLPEPLVRPSPSRPPPLKP